MLSDNPTVVAIGTILDGKFRVTKEIGRGGMAAVYEAENVDIGKRVAVKVLSAELANSKVVTERFMREARAAAKIRSPYICDVYDVGTYGGRPFLVMELLEGESLYDRLARERRLDAKDALQIATETAMGLQQAHDANIVHRDLKPENIFLARGGGSEGAAKIVDFGLAKFYDPHLEGGANARLTKEGALFGTPAYMSPEQASARGPIGSRSDLWALGCIVYEMLVGRTVWNVEQGVAMILAQIASGPLPTPSKVQPTLPKAFDAWFVKALDRDEAKRFASAREMADALRQALTDTGRAPAPSPTYTAFEAASVDALVDGRAEPSLIPPSLKAPVVGRTAPPAAIPSRMPKFRRVGGRAFAIAFAALALGMVAAVAWVYVEGPPRFLRRVGLDGAPQPVEAEPYAQLVAAAQEQLADGEFTDAIATFEHAFENGEKKAARSLRVHARVADEADDAGRCTLRGLGHPRAFDAATKSSRPTFARQGQTLISAWVASAGAKQHAVYTTRLDYALRRIGPEQMVTPEVIDAHDPQLFATDDSLLLLYADARGKESLVYGRQLSADGGPGGGAQLLNGAGSEYAYDPALARDPDGTFWVVYTQADDKRVHDLYLRHLDQKLAPLAAPVRITAYAPPEKLRTVASFASVEYSHGLLNISYRLLRGVAYQVVQLRVSPDDPLLARGGVERAANQAVKGNDAPEADRTDRFVGQPVLLSDETEVQAQPRITCLEAGCLTVWADDARGAQAALVAAETGEVAWRKNFAAAGSRPAVGRQGQQAAVAWYEGDRVRFALVEGSSIGQSNVVGWVKGLQPYPEVVAGAEPGQWYISWRAYEAAIFEPFVARVDCN